MSLTEQQIKTALSAAVDPNTGKDFVAGKAVKNIRLDGADVSFDIELGYPAKTQIDTIRKQVIGAEKKLGEGTRDVYALIRKHIPFIEADTVMYEYMETMRQLVADGKVLSI